MTVRRRRRSARRGGSFGQIVELTPVGDAWRLASVMVVTVLVSSVFGFYLGFREASTGNPESVDQITLVMTNLVFVTGLYLILTWVAMFRCTPQQLREWAVYQRTPRTLWSRVWLATTGKRVFGGRTGFVTLISYSVFGLLSAVLLIPSFRSGLEVSTGAGMYLLSVSGVLVFWAILHTAFAFQYATLYYRPGVSGGFDFPGGDTMPNIVDFAYFAFTLGTSFAASDVSVTSSQVRKVVLSHSILAFFYNTVILALVINIVLSAL